MDGFVDSLNLSKGGRKKLEKINKINIHLEGKIFVYFSTDLKRLIFKIYINLFLTGKIQLKDSNDISSTYWHGHLKFK